MIKQMKKNRTLFIDRVASCFGKILKHSSNLGFILLFMLLISKYNKLSIIFLVLLPLL